MRNYIIGSLPKRLLLSRQQTTLISPAAKHQRCAIRLLSFRIVASFNCSGLLFIRSVVIYGDFVAGIGGHWVACGQKNDIRRKQAIKGQCVSDKENPELLVLALRPLG